MISSLVTFANREVHRWSIKSIYLSSTLLIFCLLASAHADGTQYEPWTTFSPSDQKSFQVAPVACSAVDFAGTRHRSDHQQKSMIWLTDVVSSPLPDYPVADIAQKREGFGLFRVMLDLKTGVVRGVTVIQSTGMQSLDSYGVGTLSRWRWKPGKWKEIELPIYISAYRWIPATSLRSRSDG
jgi:hypothetical protein